MAVLLGLAGLGVPIPQDPVLLTTGVIAGQNGQYLEAIIAVEIGQISGDLIAYLSGRLMPNGFLERRPFSYVMNPRRVSWVDKLLSESTWRAVIVGRQVPMARTALFVYAGAKRISPVRLFAIDATVFNVHTLPVLGLAIWGSAHLEEIEAWLSHVGNAILVLIVALLAGWWLWTRYRGAEQPETP